MGIWKRDKGGPCGCSFGSGNISAPGSARKSQVSAVSTTFFIAFVLLFIYISHASSLTLNIFTINIDNKTNLAGVPVNIYVEGPNETAYTLNIYSNQSLVISESAATTSAGRYLHRPNFTIPGRYTANLSEDNFTPAIASAWFDIILANLSGSGTPIANQTITNPLANETNATDSDITGTPAASLAMPSLLDNTSVTADNTINDSSIILANDSAISVPQPYFTNETISSTPGTNTSISSGTSENIAAENTTIVANESVSSQDSKEVLAGIIISDSRLNSHIFTIDIINRTERKIVKHSESIAASGPVKKKSSISSVSPQSSIPSGIYDADITFASGPLKALHIEQWNITENETILGIDEHTDPQSLGFGRVYSIDPSSLDFSQATATVTATGQVLYKCKEWNFTSQLCTGTWAKVQDLAPGQNYTLTLDSSDPGYAEINITSAIHYSSNYTIISDIYSNVSSIDSVWSEPIPQGNMIRATFEHDLANGSTVNLYARNSNQSVTWVEIYEKDTTSPLLGRSSIITADTGAMYNIRLANMTHEAAAFDIIIKSADISAYLEFDYIHDAGNPKMILFWDGAEAPTGWTIISDNVGEDFYQRFPRGSSTYGTTAGTAAHNHTVTRVSGTTPSATWQNDDSSDIYFATSGHTHNTLTSGSSSNVSLLPKYRNLKVISCDAGMPTTIPAGAIAIFNSTIPSGWTAYTAQDTYFTRGDSSVATGGNNTHNHTVNITTGTPSTTTRARSDTERYFGSSTHTHSATNAGPTNSGDSRPPYIEVIFAKADSDSPFRNGMIAMFNETPSSPWIVKSVAGDSLNGRFLVGNSTAYGATGGNLTHSHSNLGIVTGGPSSTSGGRSDSKTTLSTNTHTHTITVSFNSKDNLPPYIDTIFAYYTDPAYPQYSLPATNTTFAGQSILFSLYWTDNLALSGYIFSFHNGSNWTTSATTSDQEPGTRSFDGNVVVVYNKSYNFSDTTLNKAYSDPSYSGTQPPAWSSGWGGSQVTAGDYTDLQSINSVGAAITAPGNNYEPFMRFNFTLNMTLHPLSNILWISPFIRHRSTSATASEDCAAVIANYSASAWSRYNATDAQGAGAGWYNATANITSGISGYISASNQLAIMSSGTLIDADEGCDIDFVKVTVAYNTTMSGTETDTSYVTYSDISASPYELITNITVTVNVSSYSSAGSSAKGNKNPDLWLELYNSTSWVSIGNFTIQSTGNYSLSAENRSIMSAWQTLASRDLRIKGRYMDGGDQINYTALWVKIDSEQQFQNDSYVTFTGALNWSNTTKTVNTTVGATIKWRIYASDASGNMNSSVIYSFQTTSSSIIQSIDSPQNQSYGTTSIWFNSTLRETGSWCGYSLDSRSNITMSNDTLTHFYAQNTTMAESSHNVRFWCNNTQGNMSNTSLLYFTVDLTKPRYSLNQTNTTQSGSDALFSLYWEDNYALAGYILSYDSGNGTFYNSTYASFSGTSAWSNATLTLNTTSGSPIRWRVYTNDTAGNMNTSSIYTLTTTDTAYPKYTLNQTNNTNAGYATLFSLYWQDSSLAGYIFSFDNCTGTFSNDTYSAMTGTGNWSNTTKTINSTVGCTIRWRVFANDTTGNMNSSAIYTLATTDDTPPSWQSQGSNSTSIPTSGSILLYSQGLDAVSLKYAVLSTNETGAWQNKTQNYSSPMSMGGAKDTWTWSNFTWKNSSVRTDTYVGWRIWYNDSRGNWQPTDIMSFYIKNTTKSYFDATINIYTTKKTLATSDDALYLTSAKTNLESNGTTWNFGNLGTIFNYSTYVAEVRITPDTNYSFDADYFGESFFFGSAPFAANATTTRKELIINSNYVEDDTPRSEDVFVSETGNTDFSTDEGAGEAGFISGDVDIISASRNNNIYWHNNTNDGSSWSLNTIDTGNMPHSVAVGDLDSDGDLDVVYGDENQDVIMMKNNGNGTFATTVIESGAGDVVYSVALGDIDSDGDLDVLYGTGTGTRNIYSRLNSNGLGTSWSARTTVYSPSGTVYQVALGDLDGDGDLDAVSANDNNDIYRHMNTNGLGTSWSTVSVSSTNRPHDVVLADIDRDRDLDIIFGDENQDVLLRLNSNSLGTSWTSQNIDTTAGAVVYAVTAGDIDGDGDVDVAYGGYDSGTTSYRVYWANNANGLGTSWSTKNQVYVSATSDIYSLDIADIDSDGDADIVSGSRDTLVRFHKNNNGAGTSWTTSTVYDASDEIYDVAVADINRDSNSNRLELYYNSQEGAETGIEEFSGWDNLTKDTGYSFYFIFSPDNDWQDSDKENMTLYLGNESGGLWTLPEAKTFGASRTPIKVRWEWTINVTDRDSPKWRNQGQNTTSLIPQESVLLYAESKDNNALSYSILSTNESGIWQNKSEVYSSPLFMNDTEDTWLWSNFTWQNASITSDTTVSWRLWYNDTYGNWNSTDIMTFTVMVPPKITIISPSNTSYPTSSVWFNATLDEQGSWCAYSLDSSPNVTMTNTSGNWNSLNSSMSEGSHIVSYSCNDTLGNMNSSEVAQYFTVDLTYPKYSENQTSSKETGTDILFSLYWQDNILLSGYIFSIDNGTGTFSNDTFVSLAGASDWSNVTKSVNSTSGSTIRWQIFANDTAGNMNASAVFSFTTIDTTPPMHSLNQTNSTEVGTDILFSLYWTDNGMLSGYIFSFDNGTGTFSNSTFVQFRGTGNWSNTTKTINSTLGSPIRWRVYANDTLGNMNASDIFAFPTIDTTLPGYSQNQTNSTEAGSSVLFSLYWTDNYALSGYIFSLYNGTNATMSSGSDDLESGTMSQAATVTGTGYSYPDTFESGWGNWSNTASGDTDEWTRDSLGTPSAGTGPCSGSSSCGYPAGAEGTDWYLFVETSSGYCYTNGETAIAWMSKEIDFNSGQSDQISWWNNMYGTNIGTLALQENTTGTWTTLWTMSGNKGTAWFRNTTDLSSLEGSGYLRFRYTCAGGIAGDIAIDQITINSTAPADTETNKTAILYPQVIAGQLYEKISNITVTVNVTYYNNSGSVAEGNLNPDLWLAIYNGTDWTQIGGFTVTASGNYTLSTQDPVLLSSWQDESSRDIRIKGVYFDYFDAGNFDTINWTGVWVDIKSEQEQFTNDTYAAFSGSPPSSWSNVTKTISTAYNTTIKWRVYANDTSGNMNASETFSFVTTDTIYPKYSQNSTSSKEAGLDTIFSLYWDDYNLAGYIFSVDNGTGSFTNSTYASFSGASGWSNVTRTINRTVGTPIRWQIFANDTAGNMNTSSIYAFTTTDTTPPKYTLNQTSTTYAGENILFSLYWEDNSYLSGYIFSFDNGTGTFENDSLASFTTTPSWSNVTKSVNYTVGTTIRWRIYANDTNGNMNASTIYTFNSTDGTPPLWRTQGSNATIISYSDSIQLYAQGLDNNALRYAILETDETGSWQNKTGIYSSPTNLGGVRDTWTWSNFTWRNTSVLDTYVNWRIWYNDSVGYWTSTDTMSFYVGNPLKTYYNATLYIYDTNGNTVYSDDSTKYTVPSNISPASGNTVYLGNIGTIFNYSTYVVEVRLTTDKNYSLDADYFGESFFFGSAPFNLSDTTSRKELLLRTAYAVDDTPRSEDIYVSASQHADYGTDAGVGEAGFISGDVDIIAGTTATSEVMWYKNTDDGASWSTNTVDSSGLNAHSVAVGDIDNDGDIDVVYGDDNQDVILLKNNGAGTFGTRTVIESSAGDVVYSVALGDIDGDGDLDVLYGTGTGTRNIYSRLNSNGLGTSWSSRTTIDSPSNTVNHIALGDLDGDGDLDAVSANENNNIYRHMNTNGLGTSWSTSSVSSTNRPKVVVLADIDRDGDLDIIFGDENEDVLLRLNANGLGTSWTSISIDTSAGGIVYSVAAGDIDGDGDVDVIYGTGSDNDVHWRANLNSLGTSWSASANNVYLAATSAVNTLAVADIDSDGDMDVISGTASTDSKVRWHSNNGTYSAEWNTTTVYSGSSMTIYSVAVADIDRDSNSNRLDMYYNTTESTETGVSEFSGWQVLDNTTSYSFYFIFQPDNDWQNGDTENMTIHLGNDTADLWPLLEAKTFGASITPIKLRWTWGINTTDTDPPKWRNQGANDTTPLSAGWSLLYAQVTDNNAVDYAILSTNETGAWQNKTGVYSSPLDMGNPSTWTWSNFTWQNTTLEETTVVGWRIWYNDTAKNWNMTDIMTLTIKDITLPLWDSQGQNSTNPSSGDHVRLYARGYDTMLGYAVLETNETGVWQNKSGSYSSPMNLNGAKKTWTWSNFTWFNTSVDQGTTVGWRIWYNDTFSNLNSTGTMSFTIKDTNAPQYRSVSSNASSIQPGDEIILSSEGYDNVALDYTVLSTNETGVWQNKSGSYGSPMDMLDSNRTWTWSNFTWLNASVISGTTIGWRLWYNDTSGNINSTPIQSFLVNDTQPPAITLVSPPSGVIDADGNLTFIFLPDDRSPIHTCALYTNTTGPWQLNKTNTSVITRAQTNNITFNVSYNGNYIWNIYCNDTVGNGAFSSSNYTFEVSLKKTYIQSFTPLYDTVARNHTNNASYAKFDYPANATLGRTNVTEELHPIVNGGFDTDIASWTAVVTTSPFYTVWDSAGYTTGDLQEHVSTGRSIAGAGYRWQAFAVSTLPVTATLKFRWAKSWAAIAPSRQRMYVDIVRPDTSVVTVWSELNNVQTKSWTLVTLDIRPQLTTAGTYNIRLRGDLRTGNNVNAQSNIFFDDVDINLTRSVYAIDRYYANFDISSIPDGVTIFDSTLSSYVNAAVASSSVNISHANETYGVPTAASIIFNATAPSEETETNPIAYFSSATAGEKNVTVRKAVNETYLSGKSTIAFFWNETGQDHYPAIYGSSGTSKPTLYIEYSDTTPPLYSSQGENSTTVPEGGHVKIYAYWTDNYQLNTKILSTNKTGAWINETPQIMSGSSAWTNFTIDTAGYPNTTIGWRIYVEDNSENRNSTPVMTFYVSDSKAPRWSLNKTNPSSGSYYLPAKTYQFNLTWTDDVAVDKVIFEWNSTSNYTVADKVSGEYYTNMADLSAGNYTYRWYANDTTGNWNITSAWPYEVRKSPVSVTLLLNRTAAGRSYNYSGHANFTTYTNITGRQIELWTNLSGQYEQWDTGIEPLENITVLSYTLGTYQVTGNFSGDTNYTSATSTHYLTIIDAFAPRFSLLSSSAPTVNKGNTINLSSYWTDNYLLAYAVLETNETTVWQNSSLASLYSFTSASEYSNFTITGPAAMTPGILGWRIYSNDTSGNLNATTPVQSVEVWGWSKITGTSVDPVTMLTGENTTIRCRVIDNYTGQPISGYTVSFYNDTGYKLGTDTTLSTGWAELQYNDSSNGKETMKCNITDYAAKYYNASYENSGTADLTTNTPGTSPIILALDPNGFETYYLNTTIVRKGDHVLIYARWNDSIATALAEYNSTSVSLDTYDADIIDPTYYWTNSTMKTNISWLAGVHYSRLSITGTNTYINDTLPYLTYEVWGWSNISWVSPQGIQNRGLLPLRCNITDANTTGPIENYNVTYFNSTGSYLGNAISDASGISELTYDFSSYAPGPETIRCNITDSTDTYYNITTPFEAESTITLFGTLATTILNPSNESAFHRGDTIWLNSTTIDDTGAQITPDNSRWFNTTSLINPAPSENYSWQIPFGHELGPELITLNTTKQYFNNDTNNITIYIWGWSKINSSSISPSNINQDTDTTAYCRITDANSTLAIQNYPVEFNNTVGILGTNTTNSTGWARYTFTDTTPGIENITCAIYDNSTLWYNITSISSANMTLSTNDTVTPKYYDISINVTGVVHKTDALLLSARWTDNYNLSYAVLETNETGTRQNSSLASPIEMTGEEYWSNFTIVVPSSMSPGTLSWRIFGNDTYGNLNVTSPLENITVWGWSSISSSSLSSSSIVTGEPVTMSCLVSDANSSTLIANYTVSFYNSTTYLGTNTTGADGWAYWKFTDYSTGIEEIKCNITDNSTLMYNASSPVEVIEYLSTQSSGAPEIYRVLTKPMDDNAPGRAGIIVYNPNPNVTTITNLRDRWSIDRVNNFYRCCTPYGCDDDVGGLPTLGNCTESSNGVVNFTGGPWNISARSYLVFWYETTTGGASALTITANLTTVQYGNQLRVDSNPVTGARASAWTAWNSTSGFDTDFQTAPTGIPKIHIVDVNKTTPYVIRLRELGGSRGLSATAFINITLPYGWNNGTMESRCYRVSDRVRCNLTSALNNGADSFAINLTSPNNINRYVLVTEVQGPDTGGFLRTDRNEHVILVRDLTTQWVTSYSPPDGYIHHKNDSVVLSVLWSDNYQLYNALLETNESGVFENKTGVYDSPQSMSGKSDYSNFTWQNITQFTGKMAWRVWSNDSSYNRNVSEHWIDIWGWSQIVGLSPPNSTVYKSAETLQVKCRVTDRDSGQPIANYPVDFWNTTTTDATYIGTSYTDASGYAENGWWTDDLHTGKYYEICNITSNESLKYNVSTATGTAYYTIVNSKDPHSVEINTYQDNFGKLIRFFDKTNETLRDTVYVEAIVRNYWGEEVAAITTGAFSYNATVYSGGTGNWNLIGNMTLENVYFGTYHGNITLDPANSNGHYQIRINASNDYGWANGSLIFHVYQGNGTSAYSLPFDSDNTDDYVLENRRMIAVYSGKENNTAPLLYVYQKEAEAEYNLSDIRTSEQDSIIGGITTENLTYSRFKDISLKYAGEDIINTTLNMRVSMAAGPRNTQAPLVYRMASDPQAVNGYVNNTLIVFNNNTAPLTISDLHDSHEVNNAPTDVVSENESCSPSCYEVTSPYYGINFTQMPVVLEGHSYAIFTYRFKPNMTTLSPSSSTVNPSIARDYGWNIDNLTRSDSSNGYNNDILSDMTDSSDSTYSLVRRRPSSPEVEAVVSQRTASPNDYYKVGLRLKLRNANAVSSVNYNVRVYAYQSDGNNVYVTSYVENTITTSGTYTWYDFDITDIVKSSGYSNIRTRFVTTENTDTISGGSLRVSEVRYNLTTLSKASYEANATVISSLGTVYNWRAFDINVSLDPAVAYLKISKDNSTFSDALGPIVGNTNQTFYMRIHEIANLGSLLAGKNVTVKVPSSWQIGSAGCKNTTIAGNTINYTIRSGIQNSYETFCFWAVAPNASAGYVFQTNVTGVDSIWQPHKDTFEVLVTTEPVPVIFNMSVTMRTDEVDYLVYKIFNFDRNITRLNRLWSELPGNFTADDRYHIGGGTDGLVSSLTSGWTNYNPSTNKYATLYSPASVYGSNVSIGWIYFNSTNNISTKDIGIYKGSESARIRFNATNATSNDSIEYLLAFPFDDYTALDQKMPEIISQQSPVMIATPDPNITTIRIYDVTYSGQDYKIDLSNLIDSGINKTFRLYARHIYRIEVDAQNPLQSTWLVDTSNVTYSQLNSSWDVLAPTDIWYILKSQSYDNGTWSGGNVTWNTTLGGRLTPGSVMTFYHVLNLTNSQTEVRQVRFSIVDPYATYEDYSTYNITRIGRINATLILPPDNTIVPWQRNFTIKINATCYDGDCWNTQAYVKYNQSSAYPDTDISTTAGATPFYIRDGSANPKDCGYLLGGDTCNFQYIINATGALRSRYEIGAVFNTTLNITNTTTQNSTLEIGKVLIMSLGFTNIDFGAGDPGSTIPAKNNTDQLYNITLDPNSNNADGGLWVKGVNLTGVGAYEVNASNIHWNSTTHATYESLSHEYQNVQSTMSSGTNTTTYYWADVPLRTMLGAYTGTIYFMVNDSW